MHTDPEESPMSHDTSPADAASAIHRLPRHARYRRTTSCARSLPVAATDLALTSTSSACVPARSLPSPTLSPLPSLFFSPSPSPVSLVPAFSSLSTPSYAVSPDNPPRNRATAPIHQHRRAVQTYVRGLTLRVWILQQDVRRILDALYLKSRNAPGPILPSSSALFPSHPKVRPAPPDPEYLRCLTTSGHGPPP
ncbi:hypothetical protein DFH08DRAFT_1043644 [Mycena albidolilacea]|uniref:Uncharacterized protein n=1 Tax=Mycena albidolilacea TaxID=1033008 RepID=A0AAD7AH58_9AGAR|nr:hypothetical protein DFH08DRAFT_1043644 [Mycena albidolilacea]